MAHRRVYCARVPSHILAIPFPRCRTCASSCETYDRRQQHLPIPSKLKRSTAYSICVPISPGYAADCDWICTTLVVQWTKGDLAENGSSLVWGLLWLDLPRPLNLGWETNRRGRSKSHLEGLDVRYCVIGNLRSEAICVFEGYNVRRYSALALDKC